MWLQSHLWLTGGILEDNKSLIRGPTLTSLELWIRCSLDQWGGSLGKGPFAKPDNRKVNIRTYILSHSAEKRENLDFRFGSQTVREQIKTCWLSHLGCSNLLCQPRKLISPTELWSRWLVAVPTLPSDRSPRYPELNRTQAAFETFQSPSTWKSWCSLKMASPASSGRGFRLFLVLPILPFLYPPTVPSHLSPG